MLSHSHHELIQERSYLSQSRAQVKNNVLCRAQMQIGHLERRVRFYDCHFQGVTYQQSLLVTQMISIYISYERIHVCFRHPRTPIAHAGLLSFKNRVSPIFLRAWE